MAQATVTTTASLRLYKAMMREAQKFTDFNFRNYFQRRVRHGFRAASEAKGEEAERHLERARKDYEMMKRQVVIGGFFHPSRKLSIEKKQPLN